MGKKIENRGSSSIAGEISELSGNSAGLSLSGEQPEESGEEMGGNLFVPQSPPGLVVPSEKSSSDSEEVEVDFLAQHRLQFLALLEAISMRNFSSTDWELFMAYKVGDVNVEQMAKLLLFVKQKNNKFYRLCLNRAASLFIVSRHVKPKFFNFTVTPPLPLQ